ncbi:MAG TPA: HEAT repeat domain-containing protein [Anaerolineaceae bacterium]
MLLKRLALLFDIHAGEGRLVSLLLLHSFFIGIAQVLLKTTSTTLYLVNYGAGSMPYVYIGSALAAPAAGLLYNRLQKRLNFRTLLAVNLGVLLLMLVFFRLAITLLADVKIITFALFVWYYIQDVLINLEFWALAGRVFDMRQTKRLFGLISGGEMLARAISGFSIPLLVTWFGTPDLLLLAIAGIGGSLALIFALKDSEIAINQGAPARSVQENKSYSALLRNPYILLMVALAVLSLIGYYFVDLIYVSQARARFTDREALAGFLGSLDAATSVLALLSGVLFTGSFISRFGVMAGLLLLPAATGAGALALAASSGEMVPVAITFWLAAGTKLIFVALRRSVDKNAARILYQPLPASDRLTAQSLIGSLVEPASSGIAGITLLLLPSNLFLLSAVLLGATLTWLLVVLFLGREYKRVLVRALTQRSLVDFSLTQVDASSLAILQKGLDSPYPGEVIYFLDILEQSGDPAIDPALRKLISHPSPQVRQEALRRIERLHLTGALRRVRDRIKLESSSQVMGTALRTLAALGETEVLDLILPFLEDPDPQIRTGAMVGLLRSGGIEGILAGGEHLIELTNAHDPSQRRLAAQVLGEVGISNFYRPLLKLLADEDNQVRLAALTASGRLRSPRLWKLVVENLCRPGLRSAAAAALLAGGEDVLPYLETAFSDPHPDMSTLTASVDIAGKIRTPKAQQFLLTFFDAPDSRLRFRVWQALQACAYNAPAPERPALIQRIRSEAGEIAWTLAALEEIAGNKGSELLTAALERHCEQTTKAIFTLLSFLYDPATVMNAWNILSVSGSTGEKRAYAVEALDLVIAAELKPVLLPLIEGLPAAERLRRLSSQFPQMELGKLGRLQEICLRQDGNLSPWTRACALWMLSKLPPGIYQNCLERLQAAGKPENAYLISLLIPQSDPNGAVQMLSTIEKVIILKTVSIFSETPEEVLAEVASSMEEEEVKNGSLIFEKGSVGTSLYIIVEGRIRMYDGERTIAQLNSRDIFGELAILDPQPQPTSAVATADTHLLRLKQEVFRDLLTDRSEVSQGVIRILTRRLRTALMEQVTSLQSTPGKERDDVMKRIFKNLTNL